MPARKAARRARIRRLTRDDLLRYYSRYYVPQNMVFVVVGNITPEAALQRDHGDLDDFPRAGRAAPAFADPLPPLTQDLPPVRVYQPDLDQEMRHGRLPGRARSPTRIIRPCWSPMPCSAA